VIFIRVFSYHLKTALITWYVSSFGWIGAMHLQILLGKDTLAWKVSLG
jgi:hypothetical protein